jgi:hypothetical protein
MNYFVKKKDGSKELVPEVVANAIFEAKTPKIMWTNPTGKHLIDLALISELLTEEEYYETHPDERPANKFPELPKPKVYSKKEQGWALENLIKSLEKYIEENPTALKTKELLETMKLRLKKSKEPKESLTTLEKILKF